MSNGVEVEPLKIPLDNGELTKVAEILLEAEKVTSSVVNITFTVMGDGTYDDWSYDCSTVNYIMCR